MQNFLFFVFALSLIVLQKTTGNTLTSEEFTAIDIAKIEGKCDQLAKDSENTWTVENPPDEYTIVVGRHEGAFFF